MGRIRAQKRGDDMAGALQFGFRRGSWQLVAKHVARLFGADQHVEKGYRIGFGRIFLAQLTGLHELFKDIGDLMVAMNHEDFMKACRASSESAALR